MDYQRPFRGYRGLRHGLLGVLVVLVTAFGALAGSDAGAGG